MNNTVPAAVTRHKSSKHTQHINNWIQSFVMSFGIKTESLLPFSDDNCVKDHLKHPISFFATSM